MVQAVNHETGRTVAQNYYCGRKESEVPTVRKLLETGSLSSGKISLDALHCKPQTLEIIAQAKGKYLVGLKENQKKLMKAVRKTSENQANLWKETKNNKEHGRIERRSYEFYDILETPKDERWKNGELRTVIKVIREREELKSGKKSVETSYYLSNEVGKYEELAQAIRRHWQVETNNYIRDVTLREDRMRSKKRV